MAIALVASASAGSAGSSANYTTAGVPTTGASLLVAAVSEYETGITGGSTVSDSKGNTWTPLTLWVEAGLTVTQVRFFYAVPDAAHLDAAHTFTCVAAGTSYGVLTVAAFSGTHATAPFDQQNGVDFAGTTIQAGSVLTGEPELIVAAVACESAAVSAIDASLTMIQNVTSTAGHIAGALAWGVQGAAGAINPTWTLSTVNQASAAIATFKAPPITVPIALVASASAGSAGSSANYTTAGVPTTGASLLVAAIGEYDPGVTGGSTLLDSKSNTWTPLTIWVEGGASSTQVRIFYALPDAAHLDAAHTFTCVAGGITYSTLTVAAFSGTLASPPFDQQTGADAVAATIQAGSVTTSEAELIVAAAACESSEFTAIDAGLTIIQNVAHTGAHIAGALAWRVQSAAGSINPTWTISSAGDNVSAALATFKVGGGAAPPAVVDTADLLLLGVG
jgi:hypothetical protein